MARPAMNPDVLGWLLESDPALRWQVERDLADAPAKVWRATRDRVPQEGFGAALLARQDPDGQWAGGAFFPAADHPARDPEAQKEHAGGGIGQPWIATTWSLTSLREWGVPASALRPGTGDLIAANSRWEYDDLPYWDGEVDVCINAMTLLNGVWLGRDMSGLGAWFPAHQMADGGWNCDWVEGSVRGSFHSTLNAIRGLLGYEQLLGPRPELRESRRRGEEYLLERHLTRRLTTGQTVADWVDHYASPFRSYYSVLRALDHFRAAALFGDPAPDPRMAEAVELVRAARSDDGRWIRRMTYPGQIWFDVDDFVGQPSRWLTFHALRVLRWWDGASVV
nr:squalene cyclase [Nakamurella flava]